MSHPTSVVAHLSRFIAQVQYNQLVNIFFNRLFNLGFGQPNEAAEQWQHVMSTGQRYNEPITD